MKGTHRHVYRFLLKLTKNTADAEDLTQETFFRAFRSFDTQLPDRSSENWVIQIAFNEFLDQCRQEKRRVKTVSLDALREQNALFEAVDPSSNPEDRCLKEELSQPLADAFAVLTPLQVQIIRLAAIEGMPYRSIASTVGCSLGTIKSKLNRARATLKKKLCIAPNAIRLTGEEKRIAYDRRHSGQGELRRNIKLL
jgi:RNA polymerase sigma-70 factor (ECF subfamily)